MKSSRLMMAGRFFLCASKVPGVDISDCKRKHQDPPLDDFERIVGKIHHGEVVVGGPGVDRIPPV